VKCRGIRGATVIAANTRSAIIDGTRELLSAMAEANEVEIDDVAGILFTTTTDLNAEFPAVAGRELGWLDTAMLCGHEIAVPGSLKSCVRVLMLWNTDKALRDIRHVYLGEAQSLRPERQAGRAKPGDKR
jgi:chorismate mutase